jgi:hypothetical protein
MQISVERPFRSRGKTAEAAVLLKNLYQSARSVVKPPLP